MLYLKKCQCPNILVCVCPVAEKCCVMLADFDYISKIGTQPRKREGTLTYRSPEVSACCIPSALVVVVNVVVVVLTVTIFFSLLDKAVMSVLILTYIVWV